MQCFAVACLMSVMWLVIVYSLAFGDGGTANALIGGLDKAFLSGIGTGSLSGTIPDVCVLHVPDDLQVITPAPSVLMLSKLSSAPCCGSAPSGLCWYAPVCH